MSVNLSAGADAFGADSLAGVDASLAITDRGLATFAFADARATASASGASGNFAFADLTLAAEGSDISYLRKTISSAAGEGPQHQSVSLVFAAVDLKFDMASGPAGETAVTREAQPPTVSGNLARFSARVVAEGDNTFVDVRADALALADTLSTVTVGMTAAVDAKTCYREISGTRRSDTLSGDARPDLIFAGRGEDKVSGQDGHDWIFGNEGSDLVYGGAGSDTIFGGGSRDDLWGGTGDDWMLGGDSADRIQGEAGADLLNGGDGEDRISGGDGNDVLCGGRGDDQLLGGAGDDVFGLGAGRGDGADQYFGGAGADLYLVQASFDRDAVFDFSVAGGDRLFMDPGAGDAMDIVFARSTGDYDDLLCTVRLDGRSSVLTLEEFFRANPEFAYLPKRGGLSDAQSSLLLDALCGTDTEEPRAVGNADVMLTFSDMLAGLG